MLPVRVDRTVDVEHKGGPSNQAFEDCIQLPGFLRYQLGTPCRELLEPEFFTPASQLGAERRKWGGGGCGDRLEDRFENCLGELKLRIIQGSLDRNMDGDLVVRVFEKRDGQMYRQCCRILAGRPVT